MDVQKEREAFESWAYSKKWNISRVRDHYVDDFVNGAWHGWQAKDQAVPEGFALVSHNDMLDLTVAINAVDLATHTESKTNEVREMWQQVALKLMALGTSDCPDEP